MTFGASAAQAAGPNVVPDLAFRKCLNRYVDQADDASISAAQLAELTGSVFCADDDMVFASGAEYLRGVTELSLSGTRVTDLSPLRGLVNLEKLYLYDTPVRNLSPLAGLANLLELYLTLSSVSDVSALRTLTKLETLDLSDTSVSNISALSGLVNLVVLDLGGTSVADISAVRQMTKLQDLDLLGARVSDLSALRGLANLQDLNLAGLPVSDVSPLAGLANLDGLDLSYTSVSNVAGLAALRKLTDLDLSYSKVRDISPLAGLPAITGICSTGGDDSDWCTGFAAVGQDTSFAAATGTFGLPILGVGADPVTVKVVSGPAVINSGAKTITYSNAGTVKLRWESRKYTADNSTGFAGAATVTVTGKALASFGKVGTPKTSGTAKIGKVLTVSNRGTWSPAPTSVGYQWYRSGAAISGATKASYTLTGADAGKQITVRVIGQKSGYKPTTSPASAAVKPGMGTLTTAKPKISGSARVASTLTAVPGKWTAGVSFAYQWYADGKKIGGATKASYQVASSVAGKKITVVVTGKLTGYTAKAVTSAATGKVTR